MTSERLPPADMRRLAGLLAEHAGLDLGMDKAYLAVQRLTPVAARQGLASVGELLAAVHRDPRPSAVEPIVDAMTINETSFFRDPHVFEALRDDVLPELIEANRASRRLRIWCAASSSGQEPYSLAMLLRESFPDIVRSWRLRILATDISPTMVARTAAGRFSAFEVARGLDGDRLARHFVADGDGSWTAGEPLRSMVEAQRLNLASPFALLEPFDLVLVRNVLIYFPPATKRAIVGRIGAMMAPGGILVLGGSENLQQIGGDGWSREVGSRATWYREARLRTGVGAGAA